MAPLANDLRHTAPGPRYTGTIPKSTAQSRLWPKVTSSPPNTTQPAAHHSTTTQPAAHHSTTQPAAHHSTTQPAAHHSTTQTLKSVFKRLR